MLLSSSETLAPEQVNALLGTLRDIAGTTKTEQAERAARDKASYHPDDPADYRHSVGMPYEDESGETFFACVGCYHCSPECPTYNSPQGRARAVLRALGEDY